jgi:hypothetical protein
VRYSRWERLHFKLFGRWPQRVVDRRMMEWHEKKLEADLKIERSMKQYERGEIDLDDLLFRTDVALGLKRK